MSINGLLPCPFCGGNPKAEWHSDIPFDGMDGSYYYRIDCCQAFACADDDTEARKRWNTRHGVSASNGGGDG